MWPMGLLLKHVSLATEFCVTWAQSKLIWDLSSTGMNKMAQINIEETKFYIIQLPLINKNMCKWYKSFFEKIRILIPGWVCLSIRNFASISDSIFNQKIIYVFISNILINHWVSIRLKKYTFGHFFKHFLCCADWERK